MERRAFLSTGISTCCGLTATSKVFAQVGLAEKELNILLDGSDSMLEQHASGTHWDLQKRGHEVALQDRDVQERLIAQQVAVRVLIFRGDVRDHTQIFEGRIVSSDDLADLQHAIQAIGLPSAGLGTYQNHALEHMAQLPAIGYRRIIDICCDDIVSESILGDTLYWRQHLQETGTDVNVLAVDTTSHGKIFRNLVSCLQTSSPTSFTELVERWSFEPFVEAAKRKLRRELST